MKAALDNSLVWNTLFDMFLVSLSRGTLSTEQKMEEEVITESVRSADITFLSLSIHSYADYPDHRPPRVQLLAVSSASWLIEPVFGESPVCSWWVILAYDWPARSLYLYRWGRVWGSSKILQHTSTPRPPWQTAWCRSGSDCLDSVDSQMSVWKKHKDVKTVSRMMHLWSEWVSCLCLLLFSE